MKEYEIYDNNGGISSLYINLFDSLHVFKVTLTSPLGYVKGTMSRIDDFIKQHKINAKLFDLQIDISGGFSTDQISIINEAVSEFGNIFNESNFKTINIFDTFGKMEWGNASRGLYTKG